MRMIRIMNPPIPTDPDIVHPNVREAIKADSNVGTLINAMPSLYDPVIKFHTVVGALFPLWLQLEKYRRPHILDQAKLSLAAICDLAEPFTLPALKPIWINDPPVIIPPTPGTPPAQVIMAYFDLLSYFYLSRLIHDVSLIIPELSVLPDRLYRSYICTRAHVNTYRTYLLSRYLATILLNAHTRVSATYLPILYRYSHAHSPSWSTHLESYPLLYL